MFSRPVRSGWNPAPISMSAANRPLTRTSPMVCLEIRESSLRMVLLPAPLGPIMPTVSLGVTEKLTSRSAQNSPSFSSWPLRLVQRFRSAGMASRKLSCLEPSWYRFQTWSKTMGFIEFIEFKSSNQIRKLHFDALEVGIRRHPDGEHQGCGGQQRLKRWGLAVEHHAADPVDHHPHRIEQVPPLQRRRHHGRGVEDRRHEQPQLHEQRHDVLDVAVEDVEGGGHEA